MALKTKEMKITMADKEWSSYKQLTNKSTCKCYSDPSNVFKLGVKTARLAHK